MGSRKTFGVGEEMKNKNAPITMIDGLVIVIIILSLVKIVFDVIKAVR